MATKKELLDNLLESMKAPVEDVQNVTGLVYGDSGGGKTVFAVQLAQAIRKWKGGNGRILFLDAVNAWRSLKNHPELHDGLVRIPYDGKVQLDLIIEAISWKQPGFQDFDVIILDEMSSMTDRDGDVVLAARSANDPTKDPDVLTQPDMGATTERMRRSIVALLKLPLSIIFVSHVRNDEDKAKGYNVTRPRFMPKFSGTIREGLDFVGHMAAKEQVVGGEITYTRSLQLHPSTTVVAKTRIGGVKPIELPQDFIPKVIDWLNGGGTNTVEQDKLINDKSVDVSEIVDDSFAGVTVD